MSDWKNVQYKDGKMRTSEGGGGGGSSTFAGLDDVSFNNVQNGQIPKYNSTTQKWENANESGGGGTIKDVEVDGVSVVNQQGVAEIPAIPDGLHHYSTTEQLIGTWIDGKPLYEITIEISNLTTGRWVPYSHNIPNVSMMCNLQGIYLRDSNHAAHTLSYFESGSYNAIVTANETTIYYYISGLGSGKLFITLQYTKTTD